MSDTCNKTSDGFERALKNDKGINSTITQASVAQAELKDVKSEFEDHSHSSVKVLTERVILMLICIAVTLGFFAPILIYAVETDLGGNSTTITVDFDVDKCSSPTASTLGSSDPISQVC